MPADGAPLQEGSAAVTGVTQRFGRFSLVGFMGALLQLTLVFLLTNYFRVLSSAAILIAVEITVLHNFIWHERFTWGNQVSKSSRHFGLRLWRFHVGNGLVSLAGNTIVMYYLVERLRAPVLPSAIGAIVLCALANFLTADRWVFRH
jgi:putative flippase GtrA